MPVPRTANGADGLKGLPGWALRQATGELRAGEDASAVAERAWRLVRDGEERATERHDEFDDPDQGGEG
jgi:hypothetical protein